jgi:hypothetical protein
MPPPRDLDRTDGVERKLDLLAAAYAAGHRDLAMSPAESIKDTLQYERTAADEPGPPLHSGPDVFARVGAPPRPGPAGPSSRPSRCSRPSTWSGLGSR